MAHAVTRKVLLGEVHQFPILDQVGDFLVDKEMPVRHAVFLRAVCKKTDEAIRAEDSVWKRLLAHRLERGLGKTTTLRPEAKHITGAYDRWLVHTATVKSMKEKTAYWPSDAVQYRWHAMKKEVAILRAKHTFLLEAPYQGMAHYAIVSLNAKISNKKDKMETLLTGGHDHLRRNKSMADMIESGEILSDEILPRVKFLVEANKPVKKARKPKKPKAVAVVAEPEVIVIED
jgi:hypothetical protein